MLGQLLKLVPVLLQILVLGQVRNEVKASGLQDTPDNCWQFFIERVRVDPACHLHSTL